MEAGMRSPGSSPLASPREKMIVQWMLCRSLLKKIVQGVLCRSLLKKIVQGVLCRSLLRTHSAASVFRIPGGSDPLGGSQRDAEEGFSSDIRKRSQCDM